MHTLRKTLSLSFCRVARNRHTMTEKTPSDAAASGPSREVIFETLKAQFSAAEAEGKSPVEMLETLTARIHKQNQEKTQLTKEVAQMHDQLNARTHQDREALMQVFQLLQNKAGIPEGPETAIDPSKSLDEQLPKITTILANAAGMLAHLDEQFDTDVDSSRKRRRLEEPAGGAERPVPDPPKTNAEVLDSLLC